jgi:solute carrier family 25 (mitochondrial phosphate transporter), member 3
MGEPSLISTFRNPFKFARVNCEGANTDEQKSLVAGRTIQAADALPGDACEFGSTHYFALCGVGGILSCGEYSKRIRRDGTVI